MSIKYLPIRLKPTVKHILKILFLQSVAALLLFNLTAFNQISSLSQISLFCRDGQPFIEVSRWSQGGPLPVIVDGEEIGQIALSADTGAGSFSFGQSDQQYEVRLLNLDGMPIAAGLLTCTNQPLGFTHLSITPAEITLTAGSSLQFTTTGEDEAGTETGVNPIWISETGSITKEGIFSADVLGDYTISASIANNETNLVAVATVHVIPLLDRIDIDPPVGNLSFGSQMLFTARVYDSAGNEILVTPNWSAAEGEISSDGWYTGTFWGEDTITATVAGSEVSATAIIETGPPLERLEITPGKASIWLGETLQFAVTGYDANGDEMPINPHWSTSGGNITYFGLYSTSDVGIFTVTVTVPGLGGIPDVVGMAIVTANQKSDIMLIYIVPLNTSVRPGERVQYTAIGYEMNSNPVEIEPIWQASGGKITASGLYTASEMGNFTIQASIDDSKVIGLALIEVDRPWYQKWHIWLMIVLFLVGTGGYSFWRWWHYS